ncbi:MAG TPA: glycosyltransferase family 4 protein [Solirubrobacteraceae bacterium]|nr:glycosyltransferase family 4 protein [Solirubrobacteraceae bacterium]
MRVQVIDPSAYTPPYDHALCAALARAGADVELVTSRFAYGAAPVPDGYRVNQLFYTHALGPPASRLRLATKLAQHVPDMMALRRHAEAAQVAHFQWLAVQPIDRYLLPRCPVVLTAHDLLPREPRPLQLSAQRRLYDAVDALVAHSEYGRRRLVEGLDIPPEKVRVIHHGAFDFLTQLPGGGLPPELSEPGGGPVVLFFGLLRPYKGVDVLLEAWRSVAEAANGGVAKAANGGAAELWIVGRPRMDIDRLRAHSPRAVRWVTRFVSESELGACFRRADVVVLPYLSTERFDFSGVLATAMAFGKATVLSGVGGFPEVAAAGGAELVPAGDAAALGQALLALVGDPGERERLAQAAREAAAGPYSWGRAAELTLELYRELVT